MDSGIRSFFKDLFQYNHHCNQELIKIIVANEGNIGPKIIILFSHILNAHHIWNSRIMQSEQLVGVWDVLPLQHYQQTDKENHERSMLIIEQYGLEAVMAYSNSKGQHFSNTRQDILFHVINHSNYHRAQIATECKNAGIPPLSTDYIFFKR